MSNCSGNVRYHLLNATDHWQPVDAGNGKMLKSLMEQEHKWFKWLGHDQHADRSYGNKNPCATKERRIKKTHWEGETYKKLCEYDDFCEKL